MPSALTLVNDDQPGQFKTRLATIVRDDISVGERPGIVVEIEPPIENAAGGTLRTAVLVPRHQDVMEPDFRAGRLTRPISVFVCRFQGDSNELPNTVPAADLSIVFWGRVASAADGLL